MNWLRSHRRSAIIVGVTLLLPLIVYLNMLFGLVGLGFEAQGRIDDLKPRIARLQGLIDNEAALRESAGQVDARLAELG
ncbi:MAG: type II secretion system protein GspM, partial [Chromatocurvus sp.]